MGQEFELKFAAGRETLARIRARYGPGEAVSMETTYYDTPDGLLSRQGITLRRRLENGVPICTVKTPARDGVRGEWECAADDLSEAIPRLLGLGAPPVLGELTEVRPICAARFTRIVCPLPGAELALDQGVLTGGGREEPFGEVEVEQKSGSREQTTRLAREIAREFSLLPQPKSKFRRALALARQADV